MTLTSKQVEDILCRLSVQADVPISDVAERLAAYVEIDIQRGYKVDEAVETLKILKGFIR